MSNYTYIKLAFTKGLICEGYQEVDANLLVVRNCDLDGNTLSLPDDTESHVTDAYPPFPSWGT